MCNNIEKKLDMISSYYYDRTIKHINLVKKYGEKINKDFSNHDIDKLTDKDLIIWYAFLTWKQANITFIYPFDKKLIDKATFKHIKNNYHHPEYWDDSVIDFVRDNDGLDNKITDASKMPNSAIYEMCADWCAMSEELNENTPFDWADKTINKRWKFTNNQINKIYKTLNTMWN